MTEFFQIAGMSTSASERLKSSVRKAIPSGPWCRRGRKVSLSCPLVGGGARLLIKGRQYGMKDPRDGGNGFYS